MQIFVTNTFQLVGLVCFQPKRNTSTKCVSVILTKASVYKSNREFSVPKQPHSFATEVIKVFKMEQK